MLDKFKYINHIGEVLEFGKAPLFVNENDLRDFSWSVDSVNEKISKFSMGIVSKTIPIVMKCKTKSEGLAMRNRIFEVFEKDVLAKQYGKIVVGDYYLRCFATDSRKSGYLINESYAEFEVTFQTDLPHWIKENTYYFITESSNGSGVDFPFDFPYDLQNSFATNEIFNTAFVPTEFKIDIYGAVVNPTIYIGYHEYSVEVEVAKGEYLTIDSAEKTIILTKTNGTKVNCFNNRNRNSYIFEKIPNGKNIVSTGAKDFMFCITLFEERSEPKWI